MSVVPVDPPTFIRLIKNTFPVAACGLVASAILRYFELGYLPDNIFWYSLGAAIGYWFIAAIVALVSRSRPNPHIAGAAVAAVWFAFVAIAQISKKTEFDESSGLGETPPNNSLTDVVGRCPISADFISAPETIETSTQMGGVSLQTTTMRSFVRGSAISIECAEVDISSVWPGLSDEQILRNYLAFWEIEPLSDLANGISLEQAPVPHTVISGTRAIEGIGFTISYRLFRFPSSFAMVAVATRSTAIDTSDVERFLSSIRIAEQNAAIGAPASDP